METWLQRWDRKLTDTPLLGIIYAILYLTAVVAGLVAVGLIFAWVISLPSGL